MLDTHTVSVFIVSYSIFIIIFATFSPACVFVFIAFTSILFTPFLLCLFCVYCNYIIIFATFCLVYVFVFSTVVALWALHYYGTGKGTFKPIYIILVFFFEWLEMIKTAIEDLATKYVQLKTSLVFDNNKFFSPTVKCFINIIMTPLWNTLAKEFSQTKFRSRVIEIFLHFQQKLPALSSGKFLQLFPVDRAKDKTK